MARLLVVDDVKFISQMLKSVFEKKGHQVSVADDGNQALQKARAEQPEAILMDIAMPHKDGIEVTRELKADPATRYIPVIIVSAKNDRETMAAATAAGADDFVAKPFSTEDLMGRVSRLLGGFRMNFQIGVMREIPTVTALVSELDEESLPEVPQALETASGGGSRPLVLDLSRVKKVASGGAEGIRAFRDQLAERGGELFVVAPGQGVGTKTLTSELKESLPVHEDAEGAIEAARAACQAGAAAAADPNAAAKIRDPRLGLSVEMRDNAALVRMKRSELGDELFGFLSDVLAKETAHVYLDMRDVKTITPADIWELTSLVEKLATTGHKLHLVNPATDAEQLLAEGGLDEQVMRTTAPTG